MQTSWQVESVTTIASGNAAQVDITFIETSNQYVGIIANGQTAVRQWTSASGITDITATVGTVPVAKSVCTTTSRIVALVSPHTIRWTSIFDITNWSDLNFAKVARTNDKGICIRDLGTKAFVLYKERSLYIGTPRGGSDAAAFGVDLVQECEGPAGLHAMCNADGVHYFMTSSGRVGMFDGSSYVQWIADGLWLYLQTDIDPEEAFRIFAVYDYRLHTVTFHYPRNGDNGDVMGLVIVNLPLQAAGIDTHASFLGDLVKPVTFGMEHRFDNRLNKTVLFSNTINNKQSFIFDENTKMDDNVSFNCHIQTGLQATPMSEHMYTSAEVFMERGNGFGSVDIYPVTSNALENKTGNYGVENYETVNLEFNPIEQYFGFAKQTRYVGLRLEWISLSSMRYAGAVIYGRGKK
jgi:hypothetical protein